MSSTQSNILLCLKTQLEHAIRTSIWGVLKKFVKTLIDGQHWIQTFLAVKLGRQKNEWSNNVRHFNWWGCIKCYLPFFTGILLRQTARQSREQLVKISPSFKAQKSKKWGKPSLLEYPFEDCTNAIGCVLNSEFCFTYYNNISFFLPKHTISMSNLNISKINVVIINPVISFFLKSLLSFLGLVLNSDWL